MSDSGNTPTSPITFRMACGTKRARSVSPNGSKENRALRRRKAESDACVLQNVLINAKAWDSRLSRQARSNQKSTSANASHFTQRVRGRLPPGLWHVQTPYHGTGDVVYFLDLYFLMNRVDRVASTLTELGNVASKTVPVLFAIPGVVWEELDRMKKDEGDKWSESARNTISTIVPYLDHSHQSRVFLQGQQEGDNLDGRSSWRLRKGQGASREELILEYAQRIQAREGLRAVSIYMLTDQPLLRARASDKGFQVKNPSPQRYRDFLSELDLFIA